MGSLGAIARQALEGARRQAKPARRQRWSDAEIAVLRRRYPNELTAAIASDLGRSINQVHAKANALGLAKSAEFLARPESGRLDGEIGAATRFQKGARPWNAGMKGLKVGGRAAETQFKPGSKPHTWAPIGSERVRSDGYLERKMTDTGYPPRDWVTIHTLLWQEHHGEIPKGYVVVFKDRDKTNIQLDNLELVSRAEMCRRNSIHRFPPELKQAIRTVGKLKRLIKERENEKQD